MSRGAGEARPLFIVGVPRSGTTALTEYLNVHPRVLVCIERYKYLPPKKITPELFTFERLLDYGDKETNTPWGRHSKLLSGKDPAEVSWVGDKYPHYVRRLETLLSNNPGARFLVTHRPVEEVAESFEARAKSERDKNWPEENGFEFGVKLWNEAMRYTRDFVKSFSDAEFFREDNEAYASLLAEFLEIELDEPTKETWTRRSQQFGLSRRDKAPVAPDQAAYARENKDSDAEAWVLGVIEGQRERLAGYGAASEREG